MDRSPADRAQVRGSRGEAQCDIDYLENWNISLECGIILRTVAQLFAPPAPGSLKATCPA